MPFTPKTPYLTTDAIIEVYIEEQFKGIVLIQRGHPPLGLALPGGFVDVGETIENACKREMKEETNLAVELTSLLGVYSDPSRDPRFHTITIVFTARSTDSPVAGDDAGDVRLCDEKDLPSPLAFDHESILKEYFSSL